MPFDTSSFSSRPSISEQLKRDSVTSFSSSFGDSNLASSRGSVTSLNADQPKAAPFQKSFAFKVLSWLPPGPPPYMNK
ncbi:hypothetical protein HDU81_007356 [Chytriomyces hyalinus]|nr:hypothetical protein HDU81_007356 [Chytriomyces hyalinus]